MLRKLSLLIVIAASIGWAAPNIPVDDAKCYPALKGLMGDTIDPAIHDISVDNARCLPTPAVLFEENSIIAELSNNDEVDHENVPIHGRIDTLAADIVLLSEDFEGETFPPTGWTQVVSNPDTLDFPCTWSQADMGLEYQHDSLGAYVFSSDTSSSDEWLITPEIDLSDVVETDVTLRFYSSFFRMPGEEDTIHTYVCISTDGGQTWKDTLTDLRLTSEGPDIGWVYIDDPPNPYEFDLSAYIGDTVLIGFNYVSEGGAERIHSMQSLDDVTVFVKNYNEVWTADEVIPVVYYLPPGMPSPHSNSYTFEEPWAPRAAGLYRLRVWISFAGDGFPKNDTFITSVTAGETIDLELAMIIRPKAKETPNEYFIPQCIVKNNSDEPGVALVKCTISSTGPISYNDSTVLSIPADTALTVEFNVFRVSDLGTAYLAAFEVLHPLDSDPTNNLASMNFIAGYPHSIVPVEAIEPVEGETYACGSTLTPSAVYENQGTEIENDWYAVMHLVKPDGGHTWNDTVHVTESLTPEAEMAVTFDPIDLPESSGDFICTFSCYMNVEDFGSSNLDVSFNTEETGVTEEGNMPKQYALGVSSNVVSRDLMIKYAIPKAGPLSLRLYDVSGKLVKTFVSESVSPGYGIVNWNAQEVPVGLYFLRMEADEFSATRKLVLIR